MPAGPAIARGLPPYEKATLHERLRASELLGKSQADFVEVRVAPVVTDPQSSEEDLVKQINTIIGTLQERKALQDAEADRLAKR